MLSTHTRRQCICTYNATLSLLTCYIERHRLLMDPPADFTESLLKTFAVLTEAHHRHRCCCRHCLVLPYQLLSSFWSEARHHHYRNPRLNPRLPSSVRRVDVNQSRAYMHEDQTDQLQRRLKMDTTKHHMGNLATPLVVPCQMA